MRVALQVPRAQPLMLTMPSDRPAKLQQHVTEAFPLDFEGQMVAIEKSLLQAMARAGDLLYVRREEELQQQTMESMAPHLAIVSGHDWAKTPL